MKRAFLLISLIALIGCATTEIPNSFYGIKTNRVSNSAQFELFLDESGELNYNYDKRSMNANVYAWGKVRGIWGLYIYITNNSDSPIHTNYFTDKFTLITKDGKEFRLEKKDISYYYKGDYINPEKTVSYSFPNPFDTQYRLINDTGMIVCQLGSAFKPVTIILKPIPKKESDSTS